MLRKSLRSDKSYKVVKNVSANRIESRKLDLISHPVFIVYYIFIYFIIKLVHAVHNNKNYDVNDDDDNYNNSSNN